MDSSGPPVFLVMGVSASGKTTLGKALAESFGIPYYDGDDFHPRANIEKMSAGIPLTDADRRGWLRSLNGIALKASKGGGAVIACSALKELYRDWLTSGLRPEQVQWIVLRGEFEEILKRIRDRKDHYMPASLLQSQFRTLEVPDYGIHLQAFDLETADMVTEIRNRLGNTP